MSASHGRAKARDLDRKGLVMLLAAGVLAVLVAVAGVLVSRHPPVDRQFCPLTGSLPASVMVIADATDPFTESQASELSQTIAEARDDLPQFGKLTLLLVDPNRPYEPAEQVSLCSPLRARDANPINHNPERVAQRWDEAFGAPVTAAIATLTHVPASRTSPLLEAVTAASWRPDWSPATPHRKLIIISDLLAHDPGDFSLYQGDPAVTFPRSKLARDATPNLAGVEVEITVLHRPPYLMRQSEVAEPFWVSWLTARGAASVRFTGEARPRFPSSATPPRS
jgi:hypothetical protein